jgi:hypothetical protein
MSTCPDCLRPQWDREAALNWNKPQLAACCDAYTGIGGDQVECLRLALAKAKAEIERLRGSLTLAQLRVITLTARCKQHGLEGPMLEAAND